VNFLCRAFSLVFLAFFALAPAAPASGRRETHWSFPALVELTTVTAPCVVEQGASEEIRVEISSPAASAELIAPSYMELTDTLVLNETVDASAAVRGARWSVKVPSHERVRFRSTSGSLTVRRAKLTIVAETVSGSIHLEGVTGELQLSTRTGAIDARRVVLTGDSGLGSETGNVRLSLLRAPTADLECGNPLSPGHFTWKPGSPRAGSAHPLPSIGWRSWIEAERSSASARSGMGRTCPWAAS